MDRTRFVVLSLVLLLICGSTLVIAAQNEEKDGDSLSVPMGIKLKPPEAVEATKSMIEFPHSRHFTYNCRECHHKWDMGPEIQGCNTSGCHDLTKAPQRSEKINMVMYYKKAFHEQCLGCHKEIKNQNIAMEKKLRFGSKNLKLLKAGPTGCKECHPKE